jgi:DNA-binding NarL/FixJ family response regulator
MTQFNFDEPENQILFPSLNLEFEDIDKISVVIIEDHELTLIGIRTSLNRDEKIVIVGDAVNGNNGLDLLNQLQPDIAIIDISLPDKDGIQITREIKEKNYQTKVIILTLWDCKDTALRAFAAGADSYCMKTIGFEKLIEVIYLTYCGHTWIDPTIARFILEQVQYNTRPFSKSLSRNTDDDFDEEMLDFYTLTERELEILQLIVDGNTNNAIASKLYITVGTVKAHVRNILMKVGAEDRTQAAVHALRYGLLD